MKLAFTEEEKERILIEKRMDRFDSVICEYCRHYKKSVEYVAQKIGCSTASLWRYRTQAETFKKAPFDIVCACLKLANVSNETLRYICGLPTGKADEN